MATISIQHEDLSDNLGKIDNYPDFLKTHTENIDNFRAVVNEVLKDEGGKYVFDYVTKYFQFDAVAGEKDLTKEQVAQIEEKYPNCFI